MIPTLGLAAAETPNTSEDFSGTVNLQVKFPSRDELFLADNVEPIDFQIICRNADGTPVTPPSEGLTSGTKTNGAGASRIAGLPTNASCTFTPTVPEHCNVDTREKTVTFTPATKEQNLNFTFKCENQLEIWMEDDTTGAALPGGTYHLKSGIDTPALEKDFTPDAQGKADLGYVPAGTYLITPKTYPAGYLEADWSVLLYVTDLPNEPTVHSIGIKRPATTLTIRVTGPNGQPYANLPVKVVCEARSPLLPTPPANPNQARGSWGMTQSQPATNERGYVVFPNQPAGSDCTITVVPPSDCVTDLVKQGFSIPDIPEENYEVAVQLLCNETEEHPPPKTPEPPKNPEPPKPPHPPLPKTGANLGLLGLSGLFMLAGVGAVVASCKRA